MDASSPASALEAKQGKNLPRFRLSLSTAILAGMVLGILTGIFFGERVEVLDILGNAFIRLLQMTILPYILASLILGIGGLSYQKARLLAARAGLILLFSWVIAFAFILTMPLGFPNWESASFFSTSLVEFPQPPNFLDLYIPANPFHSMAENMIPAVVIFAIALGIALIGIQDKEPFLNDLEILCKALMKVASMVVKLTPIGVFAIAASAAGTLSLDELSKLQVYLILFNLACLILTFWVLPLLVAALTPFSYREVVSVSRDALVTAFTTGNLFVVLPVLTEESKRLFANHGMTQENTNAYVDVIIPVSFNFPNVGKLIMLFFILFAGWFSGNEMPLSSYPEFIFSGLMSFFGGVDIALPFMLDLMRIPTDMYQFYVVTGIVNGRTATLLAAMNLFVFTLLVVSSLSGHLKIAWRKLGFLALSSGVLLVGSLLIARFYFEHYVNNAYDKDEMISNMQLMAPKPESIVYDVVPDLPPDPDPQAPRMQRIQERGEIRIGYIPLLPFAYVNDQAQLVGLDIEMMVELAKNLGVKPVFIPATWDNYAELLSEGTIDLLGSALPLTASTLQKVRFADPHMDVNAAFLVRDYDRNRFADLETMRAIQGLTIAVPAHKEFQYFFDKMVQEFPEANIVRVESVEEFFSDDSHFYDGMLMAAERAAALTLLNPSYSVMVPRPGTIAIPMAYAVAKGEQELADFLSRWIEIKKKEKTFQRYYDHWILGKNPSRKEPRWSVIRNVLGWVD